MKNLDLFEHANEILEGIAIGALLTVKKNNIVNSMVIGWGYIGIEWGKPIFTTLVRTTRFTHELMKDNDEFTISIPTNDTFNVDILKICGTLSGRDINKIEQAKLNLVDSEKISTPCVSNFPILIECKVLHRQMQNPSDLPEELFDKYYPNSDNQDPSSFNAEYHEEICGEIVNIRVID